MTRVNWSDAEAARLRQLWEEYQADPDAGSIADWQNEVSDVLNAEFHDGADVRTFGSIKEKRHRMDPPLAADQPGAQPQPAPGDNPKGDRGIIRDMDDLDLVDYTYVEERDEYMFSVCGKLLPVPGDVWRYMCAEYPHEGGSKTANEIATELALPVQVVQTLFRHANHYKSSLPFSREEVLDKPVDQLADEMVAAKNRQVLAKFERKKRNAWEKEVMELKAWKLSRDRYVQETREIMGEWTAPEAPPKVEPAPGEDWVALIPTTDVHVGLHVWQDETFSAAHYDTEIATAMLRAHGERAAEWIAAQPGKCVRVLRVDMGDLLHASKGSTERGTEMHTDSRHPKIAVALHGALTHSTECLRQVTDMVEWYMVPGNHDGRDLTFDVMHKLECYYHDADGVAVHVHPEQYRAARIAGTLHVFDHGAGVGRSLSGWKAKAQAETVARETGREDFVGADWIVTYYGHLHERQEAPQGAHHRMIRLPAFAPNDDYATRLRFAGRPAASFFRLDNLGRPTSERIVYTDTLQLAESTA